VKLIAQHKYLPAWQVAELFGLPEDEVRERYGDTVHVVEDMFNLTVMPPASRSARLSELLAVRDEELERLRTRVVELEATPVDWDAQRRRADIAEAAIARAYALHRPTVITDWQPCEAHLTASRPRVNHCPDCVLPDRQGARRRGRQPMSGGSYNYLNSTWDLDDLLKKRGDLEDMSARLAGLGWAEDAARETEELLVMLRQWEIRAETRINRLRDVWKAVEWWDSNDWSEAQVREALAKYRGEESP
jgi:hypothetical protein